MDAQRSVSDTFCETSISFPNPVQVDATSSECADPGLIVQGCFGCSQHFAEKEYEKGFTVHMNKPNAATLKCSFMLMLLFLIVYRFNSGGFDNPFDPKLTSGARIRAFSSIVPFVLVFNMLAASMQMFQRHRDVIVVLQGALVAGAVPAIDQFRARMWINGDPRPKRNLSGQIFCYEYDANILLTIDLMITYVHTNPRNPLHVDVIEDGRNMVSDMI